MTPKDDECQKSSPLALSIQIVLLGADGFEAKPSWMCLKLRCNPGNIATKTANFNVSGILEGTDVTAVLQARAAIWHSNEYKDVKRETMSAWATSHKRHQTAADQPDAIDIQKECFRATRDGRVAGVGYLHNDATRTHRAPAVFHTASIDLR
jgi:hypothetical protein